MSSIIDIVVSLETSDKFCNGEGPGVATTSCAPKVVAKGEDEKTLQISDKPVQSCDFSPNDLSKSSDTDLKKSQLPKIEDLPALLSERRLLWVSCVKKSLMEGDAQDKDLLKHLNATESIEAARRSPSLFVQLLGAVDRGQSWHAHLETDIGNATFSTTLDKLAAEDFNLSPHGNKSAKEGAANLTQTLRRRLTVGVYELISAFVVFDP